MSDYQDPRLRAEIRAVEEGHRAILLEPGLYKVVSDTEPGVRWQVKASVVGSFWHFDCDCHAGVNNRLCKHSQLVARRLESAGKAELHGVTWMTRHRPVHTIEDPFAGLVPE